MWKMANKLSLFTMLSRGNQRRKNKTAWTRYNLNNELHFTLSKALSSDIWKTVSNSGEILSGRWQDLIKLQHLPQPPSLSAFKQKRKTPPCLIVCFYMHMCVCMSISVLLHVLETEDMTWRRHFFHPLPFASRRDLPLVLNLCGYVWFWVYQLLTEPEIPISSPALPSYPGAKEIHMHATLMHENTPATEIVPAEGINSLKSHWDEISFKAEVVSNSTTVFDTLQLWQSGRVSV